MGRLSYEATEKKLRRDFEEYGPIKRIRLVTEKESGAIPDLVPYPYQVTPRPPLQAPQHSMPSRTWSWNAGSSGPPAPATHAARGARHG